MPTTSRTTRRSSAASERRGAALTAASPRHRHRQAVRRGPGAQGREPGPAGGDGDGAGRRERRRQVDAAAHPRGRARARPGQHRRSTAGAVGFASPRDAHEAGIRVIHQEPEIIPELSVAENIFIGDLQARGPCSSTGPTCSGARPPCWRGSGSSGALEPRAACRGARAGAAAADRDHARPAPRRPPALPRRADLVADRGRGAAPVRDDPRAARRRASAIVYISHRLREVMDLADRVAVLRDGELVAVRDAAEARRGRDDAADGRPRPGRPVRPPRRGRRDEVALELRAVTTAKVQRLLA